MATTKVTKSKGLKGLIGKQVLIQNRYEDVTCGPFELRSIDLPFIELEHSEKGVFWWNTDVIEGIKEDKGEDVGTDTKQ